ncbi:hypothetical protein N7467_002244 [Penicillium canescens]|nr:hypothetical protein N7467_002244 [Penicillium canescens]
MRLRIRWRDPKPNPSKLFLRFTISRPLTPYFSYIQAIMTRGNQRDNDRAKAQKKAAASKGKNTQTGSQYQKSKEDAAAIMREKQRKADEKRAAEAAGGGKK